MECGGSDTTSGLASNPTVGLFADRFIDAGGTIILSEPAEFMGAEHILAERTVDPEDGKRIYEMVQWFEDEAKRNGVDMRGTNPTPDNIEGGLTTLEENPSAPSPRAARARSSKSWTMLKRRQNED